MAESADAKAKAADKKAADKAKQDNADVETFFAFHRGEALVRENYGSYGSLDLTAAVEARQAEKDAEKSDED